MALLMDGLLIAATLFAGGYCWVLARRVEALKDLDKGLGGAIVTLTRQIELARATLEEARSAAKDTRHDLGQLSARAETAAGQLRLLLAAIKEPEMAARATAFQPPAPVAEVGTERDIARIPTIPRQPVVPRAVVRETAVEPEAREPVARPDLPKPRLMPSLDGFLRRSKPEPTAARGEDEILNALSALAGGGA